MFNKRSIETNYKIYSEFMSEFKELENLAKSKYLDELTNLLDPNKPQQFWNVINKNRKNEVKPTIQPIKKQDGTYPISDLEIIEEMKSQYGKESLDVKNTNPEWYNEVENFVKSPIENTKKNFKKTQ